MHNGSAICRMRQDRDTCTNCRWSESPCPCISGASRDCTVSMNPRPAPAPRSASNTPAQKQQLASALRNRSRPTLMMFYSDQCPLCAGVRAECMGRPELAKTSSKPAWDFVELCADDFEGWAPEMLRYHVTAVPCLVLLDRKGVRTFRHRCMCARRGCA